LASCLRLRADGLDLFVRLTPKSSADAIDGIGEAADGNVHLIARVRAAPEKGAANAALERLLAQRLDVPKRSVKLVSGSTSRLKTVRMLGDAAELAAAVETAILLGQTAKRG
jgi:uncharacterized protein